MVYVHSERVELVLADYWSFLASSGPGLIRHLAGNQPVPGLACVFCVPNCFEVPMGSGSESEVILILGLRGIQCQESETESESVCPAEGSAVALTFSQTGSEVGRSKRKSGGGHNQASEMTSYRNCGSGRKIENEVTIECHVRNLFVSRIGSQQLSAAIYLRHIGRRVKF